MELVFDYKLVAMPDKSFMIASGCATIDSCLAYVPLNEWASLRIPLKCFEKAGVNMGNTKIPFMLKTHGSASMTLSNIRIEPDKSSSFSCK